MIHHCRGWLNGELSCGEFVGELYGELYGELLWSELCGEFQLGASCLVVSIVFKRVTGS